MPFELSYPQEIILEVTNHCNLRCRHCHFHGRMSDQKRPTGFMKPSIWRKVLDELADWKKPITLITHGAGEPLLYKELFEILKTAKQSDHIRIGFMTNGMLLDRQTVHDLIDLQVDWLALSVDGVQSETHDYFRVHANLKTIEKNIWFLIEEKERKKSMYPLLSFNMVGYPEILDQSEEYVRKWLPHSHQITISAFRPIGSRKLDNFVPSQDFHPCPLLYRQMCISFDGRVALCCEDSNLDVPLGDIRKNDIAKVFRESELLLAYRHAHEKAEIGHLALCRDCHVWQADLLMHQEDLYLAHTHVQKTVTPAYQAFKKVEQT